jgi:hypothetical protein
MTGELLEEPLLGDEDNIVPQTTLRALQDPEYPTFEDEIDGANDHDHTSLHPSNPNLSQKEKYSTYGDDSENQSARLVTFVPYRSLSTLCAVVFMCVVAIGIVAGCTPENVCTSPAPPPAPTKSPTKTVGFCATSDNPPQCNDQTCYPSGLPSSCTGQFPNCVESFNCD